MSARLKDVAFLNPRLGEKLTADTAVSFVPMAAVSAEDARVTSTIERPYAEVSKGYTNFETADILVAKITPCFENGKIAQAILPLQYGFGSTEFHVIRPRPELADGRYLHHYLRQTHIRVEGQRRMTGSGGQRRVPESFLAQLPIPAPAVTEQRRIAAILDQADALRAQRREALAQLDSLTQSIFIEMFGDPVSNPKGLEICSLGNVCDVRDGTHDSPKYVTQGYPLVTSKNLSQGCVDLAGANFISESDYRCINKRSKVDVGDLLMPMIGTIGNPVLVCETPRFAIKNVALIKFMDGSPLNLYIQALLSGAYFDKFIAQKNKGGTQKFLSLGDIRSIPVPLPIQASQQTFATRIQAVEALKATHRTALAELDALFASLQHRAFTGAL